MSDTLTGEPYDSASSTVTEILELARDILDRGADRGCTRIRIRALGVEVEAEFGLPSAEPTEVPRDSDPPRPIAPHTITFPGA